MFYNRLLEQLFAADCLLSITMGLITSLLEILCQRLDLACRCGESLILVHKIELVLVAFGGDFRSFLRLLRILALALSERPLTSRSTSSDDMVFPSSRRFKIPLAASLNLGEVRLPGRHEPSSFAQSAAE